MKRTKIVCTIGPASNSEEMLEKLIKAGMNVARLNFSHGTHEGHGMVIQRIRALSKKLKQPVAILQDIAGPKIRIGNIIDGPVQLKPGQSFILTSRDMNGNSEQVSVNYKELPSLVHTGDKLLLADGLLEMEVEEINGEDILCRVIIGGPLNSHKGINLPTCSTGIPVLTEKDHIDLRYGIEQDVDYIALSFVRTAEDILQAKKIIEKQGKDIPIIAKIEKPEALANIDKILRVTDGIMVARGDLGVELPFEQVPMAQKTIIEKANAACKPVITATQMLESMVENPRPTRAEVNDVANAILDGTDAVMLSEESAMGRYPVKAVQAMSRIAEDIERKFPFQIWLSRFASSNTETAELAVSHAVCDLAERMGVEAIIATTSSGGTARQVARFRPPQIILATTPNEKTYRRLALVWGVRAILTPPVKYIDQMIQSAFLAVMDAGFLQAGQKAVISAGAPVNVPGQTNFLAVLEAGREYTVIHH